MDDKEQRFYQELFRFISEQSCTILKNLTGHINFKVTDMPSIDYSFDHWISTIEANLGPVSVYVKAHFDSATSRWLSAKNLKIPDDEVPVSMLRAFIEEYLNYLMGAIKSRYKDPSTTKSVPLTEPSYDTVVLHQKQEEVNVALWRLELAEDRCIVLQAYVRVRGNIEDLEIEHGQPLKKVTLL